MRDYQDYTDVLETILIMKPKPSPFPLIRVGGSKDGAYLIPDDLDGIAACFSPGVNNYKNFEDELVTKFGIRCHMCDYSSDISNFRTPLIQGMQTFRKKWLSVDSSQDAISLQGWVEELEPHKSEDLLLQMDIEGAEYENLDSCPESLLQRFRVIVLELHEIGVAQHPKKFREQLAPVLEKLQQHHLCVHAHPNNCCGDFILPNHKLNIPNVIEVTFLRKDRFLHKKTIYYPSLPHPLDIGCNVVDKPPLFLNEEWSIGKVLSSESTIKMLEDKLDYHMKLSSSYSQEKSNAERAILKYNQAFRQMIQSGPSAKLKTSFSTSIELAEGKKFHLSSAIKGYPSEGTVMPKMPFFFHTGFDINQYITIELEKEYCLTCLKVRNRTNGWRERSRCLFYSTHHDKKNDLNSGLPLSIDSSFWIGNDNTSTTLIPNVITKYLTIFSPEYTALHLSEIKIYGFSP
ncbi:MAG: hypothetical protein F6K30_23270 [Cyanothece sp. SIO2G6]|nr:hypothetical protein [Cyanothece sp. SIO2G6]